MDLALSLLYCFTSSIRNINWTRLQAARKIAGRPLNRATIRETIVEEDMKLKSYMQCRVQTLFLASLSSALLLLSSGIAAQDNFRILLSNDDGIESPLLHALQRELASLPDVEVVVSAPNTNQSGSSQSSIGSVNVERYFSNGSFFGYAVHGRPADAVRFGIVELGRDERFDLLVSGINLGANVGDVSHLSGTVGAAMEGVYHGIPSIAVSQDTEGVDTQSSARFAASIVQQYRQRGMPADTMLSINIPRGELKGVAVRPMGDSYLKTQAYHAGDKSGEITMYERERIIVQSEDSNSDTYAYQQGYISVTPLSFDWTAYPMLETLESWDLELVD